MGSPLADAQGSSCRDSSGRTRPEQRRVPRVRTVRRRALQVSRQSFTEPSNTPPILHIENCAFKTGEPVTRITARGCHPQAVCKSLPASRSYSRISQGTTVKMGKQAARLVVPPPFSRRLLISSLQTSVSVIAAAANGIWDSCFLATLVLTTSVNYWRRPTLGWRRNVDIAVAGGSLLYQLVYSSSFADEKSRSLYRLTVVLGMACYGCSRYFTFARGDYNVSTIFHSGLHFFGNAGNVVLYDAIGHNALGFGAL